MNIRSVQSSDYYTLSPLINEWWGGRNMSDKLPKLFLITLQIRALLWRRMAKSLASSLAFYRNPRQMKHSSILLGSILITENRILQKII